MTELHKSKTKIWHYFIIFIIIIILLGAFTLFGIISMYLYKKYTTVNSKLEL